MDATLDSIAGRARTYLRDFPLFFEVDQGPLNTLTDPPAPPAGALATRSACTRPTPPTPPATDRSPRRPRPGNSMSATACSRSPTTPLLNKRLLISGYHFSWFLDSDLSFHAGQVLGEMTLRRASHSLDSMAPAHLEVVMLGTIVHALWSLSMELMLDIDVSTPEGMFIPARQRYAQVLQMLGAFEAEYQNKADDARDGPRGAGDASVCAGSARPRAATCRCTGTGSSMTRPARSCLPADPGDRATVAGRGAAAPRDPRLQVVLRRGDRP